MNKTWQLAVDILVAHQRHDSASCLCGWATLGASHPEHIANVLEAAGVLQRSERPMAIDYENVLHTDEERALVRGAFRHPNNSIENRICFELMTMPTRNRNEATAMFHFAPKIAKHLAERMDLMLKATGGR